jgi:hypothetical protein
MDLPAVDTTSLISDTVPATRPTPKGMLGAWWCEGLRGAVFMRPRWDGLQLSPAIVACLALVPMLIALLLERLHIVGPAMFYWRTLVNGWSDLLVLMFACWLAAHWSAQRTGASPRPDGLSLFALACAQLPPQSLLAGIVFLPMSRGGIHASQGMVAWWIAFIVFMAWFALSQVVLIWRSSGLRLKHGLAITILLMANLGVHHGLAPSQHWWALRPTTPNAEEDTPPVLQLTQDVMEQQPQLLQAALQQLPQGRQGVTQLYAITFAPYADEDVFTRESAMVAGVMDQRFAAAGKTVQLVNNPATARTLPWATPLNLQRAIQRAGQVMNRDEDVLFIHLTSHGARNGQLSAQLYPLQVDPVTPAELRHWLDDAGIRYRVISISACYSGSWVAPLAEPGTLVMTAADADHTSYGCGRGSPLTFFGRAMYDEQLRQTLSFEKAHAAARLVIDQREKQGGKSDGYSNPQIRVGDAIRPRLQALEARLNAPPPPN